MTSIAARSRAMRSGTRCTVRSGWSAVTRSAVARCRSAVARCAVARRWSAVARSTMARCWSAHAWCFRARCRRFAAHHRRLRTWPTIDVLVGSAAPWRCGYRSGGTRHVMATLRLRSLRNSFSRGSTIDMFIGTGAFRRDRSRRTRHVVIADAVIRNIGPRSAIIYSCAVAVRSRRLWHLTHGGQRVTMLRLCGARRLRRRRRPRNDSANRGLNRSCFWYAGSRWLRSAGRCNWHPRVI